MGGSPKTALGGSGRSGKAIVLGSLIVWARLGLEQHMEVRQADVDRNELGEAHLFYDWRVKRERERERDVKWERKGRVTGALIGLSSIR